MSPQIQAKPPLHERSNEDHKKDFRLHRKYLLVTNLIIWLYIIGGVNISEFSILGTKLNVTNPIVIPITLVIIILYSFYRFSQFYNLLYRIPMRKTMGAAMDEFLTKSAIRHAFNSHSIVLEQNEELGVNDIKPKSDLYNHNGKFIVNFSLSDKVSNTHLRKIEAVDIEFTNFMWSFLKTRVVVKHRLSHPDFMDNLFPFSFFYATVALIILRVIFPSLFIAPPPVFV